MNYHSKFVSNTDFIFIKSHSDEYLSFKSIGNVINFYTQSWDIIYLNNKVIGYTALVFDETIPEKESHHWLWQFTIDQHYQNKGYGTKILYVLILAEFLPNYDQIIITN